MNRVHNDFVGRMTFQGYCTHCWITTTPCHAIDLCIYIVNIEVYTIKRGTWDTGHCKLDVAKPSMAQQLNHVPAQSSILDTSLSMYGTKERKGHIKGTCIKNLRNYLSATLYICTKLYNIHVYTVHVHVCTFVSEPSTSIQYMILLSQSIVMLPTVFPPSVVYTVIGGSRRVRFSSPVFVSEIDIL